MAAISSSSSQTASTLAQALAKLAADEAARAPAKTITGDEAQVAQLEKSQTSSSQTSVDVSA
jgi:hypothetical protein